MLTPLHDEFGVEVREVDIRVVSKNDGYDALRDAFEEHSLLLFRKQSLDDDAHREFGPFGDQSRTRRWEQM